MYNRQNHPVALLLDMVRLKAKLHLRRYKCLKHSTRSILVHWRLQIQWKLFTFCSLFNISSFVTLLFTYLVLSRPIHYVILIAQTMLPSFKNLAICLTCTSCCMKESRVSQPKDFVSFFVPTALSLNWKKRLRWVEFDSLLSFQCIWNCKVMCKMF